MKNVPISAEQRAESVLRPDEKLLWHGVPAARCFLSLMVAHVIFGMIPFAFGAIFLFFLVRGLLVDGFSLEGLAGTLFGGTIALLFAALGVGCFLYPFKLASRLREVVYILTDRRAVVLTSSAVFWNPVPALRWGETIIEFSPDQLRQYEKKWQDLGRTDLVFHKEWRKSRRRGGEWWYYGFLGLKNPDEPERLIQKYFASQHVGS